MKAGLFAGGAAWGAYWVGYHSEKKPIYDAYIGTSTGALIALFLALGRIDPIFYDLLVYEYSNTTNRQMYGWMHPFKKDGSVNKAKLIPMVVKSVWKDENHVYDITKELFAKIRKHFTNEHFKDLLKEPFEIIVTSKNIERLNSGTKYISNKHPMVDFEQFVQYVVSSAAIPEAAKPVMINGNRHVDGGVLDPVPTKLIRKYDSCDIFLCQTVIADSEKYRSAEKRFGMWGNLLHEHRQEIKVGDLDGITNANVHYMERVDFKATDFNPKKMKQAITMGIQRYRSEI